MFSQLVYRFLLRGGAAIHRLIFSPSPPTKTTRLGAKFRVRLVAAEVFTSCGRVDNYSRREKNLGYKCRKSQIRSESVSVQGNIEIYCMACARSRYNACSDWLILLSGACENKAKSHIINTFLTLIVLSYGKISNLGLAVSLGQYDKVSL